MLERIVDEHRGARRHLVLSAAASRRRLGYRLLSGWAYDGAECIQQRMAGLYVESTV
jgi:hypothetical protein